ncbi:Hypothetical protein Cp262_2104 [Corynebacterium pseudotuberculosis]|uniref:hypothetical protein n=1 Tax=Corynebacterium TaxID=1716 RepID=UPI000B609EC0|nr:MULTISPECIES: hypothetical protein [Corynebacterium]ARX64209.1 Hypothetical protein Cp262_2104 [Corynebacterium pseudotuberculosis]
MGFLDSLGISTTADEAMVARVHQQATTDSDYDNNQDNWRDNTLGAGTLKAVGASAP